MMPLPTISDRLRRFQRKVVFVPPVTCHVWVGGINEHGYGVFWNGRKLEKAHRFALRASGVTVPDDLDVIHSCDFPPCVNPAHLSVGTAKDNVNDMWAKSRATVMRHCGEAQTQAKLTDLKVARIRSLYATGAFKQRDLATMFGVSQKTIWRVVNRTNWLSPSGVVTERFRGRA